MKAIGYIRVSTQEQTDGVSLEAQQAKIEAWCQVNDYDLVAIYSDAGISGKAMDNRQGLGKVMDVIGKGDALVAYSLSRLSRSTKDMLDMAETLERKGADLVSLTEKVDTTTAAGKMVFRMLAVLNEFERDQVSERTKSALSHKKSKGERIGTVPYGYRLDADGISLVKFDVEQKLLAKMRRLRRSGRKLREIADRLNADGFVTRRGRQWQIQHIHHHLNTSV